MNIEVPKSDEFQVGDLIHDYTICKSLGGGDFGKVYKVESTVKNETFAMKAIQLVAGVLDENMKREVDILSQVKHDNIVSLEEYFVFDDKLCLIMEFVPQTLEDKASGYLSETIVKGMVTQITDAIAYLHQHDIVHRDLNLKNILVTEDGTIKVADFGFSRRFTPGQPITPLVCNARYSAPEILLGASLYGKPADVWSIGCVMAQLITNDYAFPVVDNTRISKFNSDPERQGNCFAILKSIFSVLGTPTEADWPGVTSLPDYPLDGFSFEEAQDYNLPIPYGSEAVDLLQKMLKLVPSNRITIEEVQSHPFLSG